MAATDETGEKAAEIEADHRILRAGCGILDRSAIGKLALTGPQAAEFLTGQVTNDIEGLAAGEGRYAALLTHKGKMLGDLRVLAIGASAPGSTASAGEQPRPGTGEAGGEVKPAAQGAPAELLLITERVCLQALFDTIRRFKIGYEVQLHKRTLQTAMLSLIGPDARAVSRQAAASVPAEAEHSHCAAQIAGCAVRLVATAQPAGVDVLCDAGDRDAVEAALRAAGGLPVGEEAAEIVRIEEGRPRYGVELDDTVIPQEAGLNERAVSFTKGCYVGQETVARLYYKGRPNRHLRGLLLAAEVPPGTELSLGSRPVGRLGSFAASPALGPIGLALLRREAEPGSTLAAGGQEVAAEVIELPFNFASEPAEALPQGSPEGSPPARRRRG